MLKGSVELFRVGGMKVKFNLVIRNETAFKNLAKAYQGKLVEFFSYGNAEYLKISPKPYLTLDISNTADKNDEWDPNMSVNLNKFAIFDFIKKTKAVISSMSIPEMYFNQNGMLRLNGELAKAHSKIVPTPNKSLCIIPAVLEDKEDSSNYYEGVAFMINSIDNYCILPITEVEYLCFELQKLDLYLLSMEVINTYLLMGYGKNLQKMKVNATFSEKKPEIPETTNLPKIETPSTIPNDI